MKKICISFIVLIIALFSITVNAEDFFAEGKNLYSDNVYMVNADTGKVVYELDSETKAYPASTTKILTCILAIEKAEDLDATYEIPYGIFDDIYAQGGANMNLKYGEVISVRDLIEATMIRSACDSASALACYVSGSVEEFAKLMNEKAAEIGSVNSHFVNAHGLHDDNHYSTAKDMYLITEYALQNETFCDIIKEYSCTVAPTNKSDERVLSTTMNIEDPQSPLYYEYVTGIKSGFTDQAGRCLVTKATKNGLTYILVTLGANRDKYYESNMAFTDAVTLYEYFFAQYSLQNVIEPSTQLSPLPVSGGKKEELQVVADSTVSTLVALDEKPQTTISHKELRAPITKGDKVGTAEITVGDEVFTVNLIAAEDIEVKSNTKSLADMNDGNIVATSMDIGAIVICAIAVIIIAVFVIKLIKKSPPANNVR